MKSQTNRSFRELFRLLPDRIKEQTRSAYRRFKLDPNHPSLQFKRLRTPRPLYSVRINLDYRAVGEMIDGTIVWFWVGAHADYEQVLKRV